jgi:hypothetical protein
MSDLVVEDYYSGLSLPAGEILPGVVRGVPPPTDSTTTHTRPSDNANVGLSSPFPTSPEPTCAVTSEFVRAEVKAASAAPKLERQVSSETPRSSSSRLEPQWEAQYDYDDAYDYGAPASAAVFAQHAAPAVQRSFADTVRGAGTTAAGEEEDEGVGGFYSPEEHYDEGNNDSGLVELDESSDEEYHESSVGEGSINEADNAAVRQHHFDEARSPGTADDASVKSIVLDDSMDEYGAQSGLSQSGIEPEQDAEEAPQVTRSVFGLKNFSLWKAPAPPKKPAEEFELKDFNPIISAGADDDVEPTSLPAEHSASKKVGNELSAGAEEGLEWMQQELSASQHTAPGKSSFTPHTVVATSHLQSADFAYSSDPEDGDTWASPESGIHALTATAKELPIRQLAPQFEADFGEDDGGAHYEADFGDDAPVRDASMAVPDETEPLDMQDTGGEGWKRYPEGLSLQTFSPDLSPRYVPVLDVPAQVERGTELPVLDDLDRAWQQQQGDYDYSGGTAKPMAGQSNAAGTKPAGSVRAPAAAATQAPQQLAATADGARKAVDRASQPLQASQWYINPDQLEVCNSARSLSPNSAAQINLPLRAGN